MFRWLARTYLVLGALFILYSWYLTALHQENFFKEGTFFTWVSSVQISAVVFLCLAHGALFFLETPDEIFAGRVAAVVVSSRRWGSPVLWFGAASFFFYLAADEIFQYHEGGGWLATLWSESLVGKLGPERTEIVLFALYLMVAGVIGWRLWRGAAHRPEVLEFLRTGAFILFLSIFFDNFPLNLEKQPAVIFEDGFKFMGFSCLVLGFVRAYVLRLQNVLEMQRLSAVARRESAETCDFSSQLRLAGEK